MSTRELAGAHRERSPVAVEDAGHYGRPPPAAAWRRLLRVMALVLAAAAYLWLL